MGGEEFQILFLGRAHTGGDLSVYLPKEKILFLSETFLNRVFPAMRSAYPSEWLAALEQSRGDGRPNLHRRPRLHRERPRCRRKSCAPITRRSRR